MRKSLCERSLTAAALLAGAALLATAVPVQAQTVVEEITVTGAYGPPDNVQRISQVVSFADLDLATPLGQRILRHRIALTARYLCNKLGESETSSTADITPTCREDAVKTARERVNAMIASFPPRGATWVAPPAWSAPYPAAWDTTYPE